MIPSVQKTLMLVWPLMVGILCIMVGNGLQGTLLGLRANIEEFPVYVTGIIMSLYYIGFVIGCGTVPNMVASVGHIRVFAAMASLASTTILLHGMFVDPWLWGIIRIASGLSFAGMFIVAESWLNNIATNKLRGQIFSIYIFVIYVGLFSGQFLINIAPLSAIDLFILISILVSVALIPITLANKPTPGYETPEKLPLKKLANRSPLAFISVFGSGITTGSVLGIGAVYASQTGLDTKQIAIFIATYITGSGLIPLFTGWLSDRMNRRKLIIIISFIGTLTALGIEIFHHPYAMIFMLGGATTSIYSIAIAYMNDQVKETQMLSATTSMIFVNAVGACLGPLILGIGIQKIGLEFFFLSLAAANAFVCIAGIYRAFTGHKVIVDEQNDFVNIPARSSPAVIHINEDE